MMRAIVTMASAMILAACGGPATPIFKLLGQRDTWAMTYDPAIPRSDVEAAAREKCGSAQFCKVMGWADASRAAKSLPTTDREVEGMRFAYTLNRGSGMDEFAWTK